MHRIGPVKLASSCSAISSSLEGLPSQIVQPRMSFLIYVASLNLCRNSKCRLLYVLKGSKKRVASAVDKDIDLVLLCSGTDNVLAVFPGNVEL